MSIFKDQDNRILFRYLLVPHVIFSILLLIITNMSMEYIIDFIYNFNINSYQTTSLISFAFGGIIIRVSSMLIVFGAYLFFFTKGLKKLNEKLNFSSQPIKMSSVLIALVLTSIATAIVSVIPVVGKIAVVFLLPVIIDMIFIKKINGSEITLSWQEIKDNFNYYMTFSIKILLGIIGIFLILAAIGYIMIYTLSFDLYFLFIQLFIFLVMMINLYVISVVFTYVIKNANSKCQAEVITSNVIK